MPQLKIAVPNKGRLSEETVDLLKRAGIRLDFSHERKLFANARGGAIQVLFLRAQDIPEFVADGIVHMGITGRDIIAECGRDVTERMDLGFGRCRLVVAVPEDSDVEDHNDIPRKVSVATSFPNLTRAWFQAQGIEAKIIPVSGATEVAPHIGVADLITDLTSTGSTLVMNGLREVANILDSTARIIQGPRVKTDGVEKIADEVVFALGSVIAARRKRYLLADVPKKALDEIRTFLPGIAGPTVVEIAGDPDTVAIHVVVDEDEIHDAVNRLKRLGGRGILVMPIDRMVA